MPAKLAPQPPTLSVMTLQRVAIMLGLLQTLKKLRTRSPLKNQTHGACTICMAMFQNGALIITKKIPTAPSLKIVRLLRLYYYPARIDFRMWPEAVLGQTNQLAFEVRSAGVPIKPGSSLIHNDPRASGGLQVRNSLVSEL